MTLRREWKFNTHASWRVQNIKSGCTSTVVPEGRSLDPTDLASQTFLTVYP